MNLLISQLITLISIIIPIVNFDEWHKNFASFTLHHFDRNNYCDLPVRISTIVLNEIKTSVPKNFLSFSIVIYQTYALYSTYGAGQSRLIRMTHLFLQAVILLGTAPDKIGPGTML